MTCWPKPKVGNSFKGSWGSEGPQGFHGAQRGEMWKFDAGLSLNNYQADTGWGGVIGQPNAQQNMIWEATLRGYNSAMSVIKEGVRPSEIQNAMIKGTQDGGLANHSGTFAGHAIGLEMRELPYVLGNKKIVNSL